jgi:multimeric flavodoxin WrbA
MRITAIVGSTRRGNTYSMVEAGCHGLKDCDVELIHLKDLKIEFCDGCLTCDTEGECHHNDDMKVIINKLVESDGFIFGTPVRWNLLSGELKVFLDRLNPVAVTEKLRGKRAILFVVGQSNEENIDSIYMAKKSLQFFCDSAGIDVIESVEAIDCLNSNDLISKYPNKLNECKVAAKNLIDSIKSTI